MAKRGTLTVRVVSDTKAAERGLQQFGNTVDKTGDRMQAAGKKMTMFATVPIVGAMTLATSAASELEQAIGGTEAVFGDASGAVDDFAKRAPRAIGLTENEFRVATTLIGGQLKRMTGDVDMAAEQSVELTKVAADLAATYGGTTQQAVEALGAAFRGEADPAERFNLNLKIGEQNAKAVEMGLAATTAEVDENARAQALLALIMEQSADAQGQFAREQDTAAGAMAIARAEIGQAAAEIGMHLLPIVSKAAGGIGDLASAFGDLPDPVQQGILALAGIVAAAGPTLTVIGKVRSGASTAASAFETMRLRGMYLKDSLGKAGLAGALGVAAVGIGLVVQHFHRAKQEAAESERRVSSWSDAIREAGSVAEGTTDYLADLVRENGDLANAMADSGVSLDELQAALVEGGSAWAEMGEKLAEAGLSASDNIVEFGALADQLTALHPELQEAAKRSESTEQVLGTLDKTAEGAGDSTEDMGDQISGAAKEVKALEDAAKKLTEAFNILNGKQMGVDEAAANVAETTFELTEAFKENGKALNENGTAFDINTAKGRANQEQFFSSIAAAQRHAAAMIEDGASVDEATAATLGHVESMKEAMSQAGFTEGEIKALIERYNLTPDQITTSVELLKAEEAERKLNELARTRYTSIVVGASLGATARRYLDEKSHAGGRVPAGVPRLIGRQGHEELFVPDSPGRIHSVVDANRILAGVGSDRGERGGGGMNFYGPVTFGSEKAVDDIDWWTRTQKAGI